MFVRQVVTSRRDAGLRDWARWMHDDLGSWPHHWLRADHYLSCFQGEDTKTSRILVEPHLTDAEFCKAWMSSFCGSGHPGVTVSHFLGFVVPFFASGACY